MPSIEVLEASAAEEIALAAVPASTLKTFIASDMTTAAAATSICPTFANSIAALPAPPRTFSSGIPALSNSRKLSATAAGPMPIDFDKSIEALVTSPMSFVVAPVLAWMFNSTS